MCVVHMHINIYNFDWMNLFWVAYALLDISYPCISFLLLCRNLMLFCFCDQRSGYEVYLLEAAYKDPTVSFFSIFSSKYVLVVRRKQRWWIWMPLNYLMLGFSDKCQVIFFFIMFWIFDQSLFLIDCLFYFNAKRLGGEISCQLDSSRCPTR